MREIESSTNRAPSCQSATPGPAHQASLPSALYVARWKAMCCGVERWAFLCSECAQTAIDQQHETVTRYATEAAVCGTCYTLVDAREDDLQVFRLGPKR